MLDKQFIIDRVEERALETGNFMVDVKISSSNQITVEIDHPDRGVSVKDCMSVSRNVEHNLDREVEDFSITVTSPGVGEAYKVYKQYPKNVGRDVKILFTDGTTLEGELVSATEEKIEVKTSVKERIEGRKAKHWVDTIHEIGFDRIKETKTLIKF